MFATWKLRSISENLLDSPEATVLERGGTITPLCANGAPESGALILGVVTGDVTGLEAWEFKSVTKTQAKTFIAANFNSHTLPDGSVTTLEMAQAVLG